MFVNYIIKHYRILLNFGSLGSEFSKQMLDVASGLGMVTEMIPDELSV